MSSARFRIWAKITSLVKDGIWIPAFAGMTPAKEMRGQDNWWGKPHPTFSKYNGVKPGFYLLGLSSTG